MVCYQIIGNLDVDMSKLIVIRREGYFNCCLFLNKLQLWIILNICSFIAKKSTIQPEHYNQADIGVGGKQKWGRYHK